MSLGAIFCAQAGGMSLPIATQLSIMGTLMLTSKGIAAVPRGSMIIMAGTISQYNLPMAALTMLMGVDAILDMGRTSINVMGNCLACCVMSRIEGTFRGPVWREEEIERRRRAALDDNEKSAAAAAAVGSILPSTTQDLHQHNEKEINEDKIDVIMHETVSPASSIKNNQEDHKAP
ncbi:SDF-domain-containing protein [Lichtheimia hyalospora FSU 10163]|nr:SDF-domain-containing protein [Lichtheimia hyalospora FSU 10163]